MHYIFTWMIKGILSRKGKPFVDSTIWHMLKKPIYAGLVVHKGKTQPGQQPAIISKDLFDHVQTLIERRPRQAPDHTIALPYAGLIRCEECGSSMTAAYTNKLTKAGTKRRYYYYRCSIIGHKGWRSCSTRQIGAERFHETVQRNLHRISMDSDYVENVLFKLKNQTQGVEKTGYEPIGRNTHITAENVQGDIREFLKICARKPGIEKSLGVRGRIQQVRYSKQRVCVDFRLRPVFDGKRPTGSTCPAAAIDSAQPAATAALKRKEPNHVNRLGSFPMFDAFANGGVLLK